jgi:DNA-binding XRE family transcriptional regulator
MTITVAIAGRCPDELSRSLRNRGLQTIRQLDTEDLEQLAVGGPDVVLCFAGGAPERLLRLVRRSAHRWFTAVIGGRDWPHATAVIQAGAQLYLVRERPGDDDPLAATIAAVAVSQVGRGCAVGRLAGREGAAPAYVVRSAQRSEALAPPPMATGLPVGVELRRLRRCHGLSQRQMARLIGLAAHSAVADYESGKRLPANDIIIGYEHVFGLADGRLQRLRAQALIDDANAEYRAVTTSVQDT